VNLFYHWPATNSFARSLASAIAVLALCGISTAQNSPGQRNLYVISAPPSSDSTNLYILGRQGNLRLARKILNTWPYEIADDQQGTLYVIAGAIDFPRPPGAPLAQIAFLHEDEPQVGDTITVDQRKFSLPTGDGIPLAVLSPTESCLLLLTWNGRPPLVRIIGTRRPGEPRRRPGKWSDYTHLRYAGNENQSLEGWFAVGKSVYYPTQAAALAPAPPIDSNCGTCTSIDVLVASARFLVLIGNGGPFHRMWVYDKTTRKWQSFPYQPRNETQPSYKGMRIFGPWLAGAGPPKGALQLRNLLTRQTVDLPALAATGEVLTVSRSGMVLYRSNDSIFSISLTGGQPAAPRLLVTNPIIASVHWAFWSGTR
jgi:hypothetical protein